MNLIKTYLLPLILLFSFSTAAYTQSTSCSDGQEEKVGLMTTTDSILINCYYTEKEYNRIQKINQDETAEDYEYMYEDEIYSDKKYKKRGRNTFRWDIPAELVVDVVMNTLFFIAILWQ